MIHLNLKISVPETLRLMRLETYTKSHKSHKSHKYHYYVSGETYEI